MSKKLKSSELGFGTLASERSQRFMNPDGSANVHRIGGPRLQSSDIFHTLTTMKFSRFLLVVMSVYVGANLIFASLYLMCGIENLGIKPTGYWLSDYLEAFFFSTQCFTTIGFGRVNPQDVATNIIASAEGLAGLLSFALATGLLYGRFSRPKAHLIHSENLLIAPYLQTKRAAMFRIASTRKHSLLIDNSVSVSLGMNSFENGQLKRRFYILDLEINKINFLNLSWTIVHPITESSPLWGKSMEDLEKARTEFIVLFKAIEETNSQTVIERFSYFIDEIIWGAKFISAIGTSSKGKSFLDLDKISMWEKHELPPEALSNKIMNEDNKPHSAKL